jgi:hypothetical protein
MGLSYIDRIICLADNVEADLAMRDRKRPYSWSRTIKDAEVRQHATTATATTIC